MKKFTIEFIGTADRSNIVTLRRKVVRVTESIARLQDPATRLRCIELYAKNNYAITIEKMISAEPYTE